jgi:hypothetical protein
MGRRKKSDEPLLVMTFRVPAAVRDAIKLESVENGVTVSDVIRTHFESDAVKPLANPRPSYRPKRLSAPKGSPEIAAQLAKIGNNLNQIARQVNAQARASDVDILSVLTKLAEIEQQVKALDAH